MRVQFAVESLSSLRGIRNQMANQLHELGFRHMHASSLKPKHIDALIERWRSEQLNPGTIKNRLAHLRWLAEKTGKSDMIPRSNDAYGIPERTFVSQVSKATQLDLERLARMTLVPPTTLRRSGRTEALTGQVSYTSSNAKGRKEGATNGRMGMKLERKACGI